MYLYMYIIECTAAVTQIASDSASLAPHVQAHTVITTGFWQYIDQLHGIAIASGQRSDMRMVQMPT